MNIPKCLCDGTGFVYNDPDLGPCTCVGNAADASARIDVCTGLSDEVTEVEDTWCDDCRGWHCICELRASNLVAQ